MTLGSTHQKPRRTWNASEISAPGPARAGPAGRPEAAAAWHWQGRGGVRSAAAAVSQWHNVRLARALSLARTSAKWGVCILHIYCLFPYFKFEYFAICFGIRAEIRKGRGNCVFFCVFCVFFSLRFFANLLAYIFVYFAYFAYFITYFGYIYFACFF